jgi:dTDP-4-dehydrorhamnose reductase
MRKTQLRDSSRITRLKPDYVTKEGPKLKILLTGKTGQVGRELAPLLARMGELTAFDRPHLDLGKPEEIRRVIRSVLPDLIVNAAAYTAVDRAESDEAAARAINADAPAVMAEEAKPLGALLVHYSTDYVFDGTKRTPYEEDDTPHPLNAYGRTKLEGERAIQQIAPAYLIFRTAWVYAREGRNFLLTVLRLAAEKEELKMVRDQTGAPTWSGEIAAATAKVLSQVCAPVSGGRSWSATSGIYHMTAGGETNWYSFAKRILELAAGQSRDVDWFRAATRDRPLMARRIVPIATDEFSTPARRPSYSVLANGKLNGAFAVQLPHWEMQLRAVFSERPSEMHMPGTTGEQRPGK